MPVGKFEALKSDGRATVSADAEAAPVEGPSAHKVEGTLAASTRCKTAPGDGSAVRTPDGTPSAFADIAAVDEIRRYCPREYPGLRIYCPVLRIYWWFLYHSATVVYIKRLIHAIAAKWQKNHQLLQSPGFDACRQNLQISSSVPVERFAASDRAVEETAASATGEMATAMAVSALLCHVENGERSIS